MSRFNTLCVLIFGLFTALQIPAAGQSAASRGVYSLSDYNTWDFGMSVGLTYPRTDISGKGGKFGASFDVTKFLSHRFALQARLIHATLAGEDINRPDYQYNTTIHYDLTMNVVFQSTNLIFLPKSLKNKFALYVSAGAGVISYTPDIWLDGGNFKLGGVYSQYSQNYDTLDFSKSTDFILPFAIGTKFRVSERTTISAEYTYRTTNTDKVDGFFKLLSSNDSYSIFSLGVVFHLGKESKTLEWENPLQPLYDALLITKSKVETLRRDTDGDGVPDYHDKEPETPPGTRVYGDGTSVDSDNDGVPDRIDEEPFSSRNAKVDSVGREIRPLVIPLEVSNPEPAPVTLPEVLPAIYFDYDSHRIGKEDNDALAAIANSILANPTANYLIVAMSDDARIYNIELDKRRAESVKRYLMKNFNISGDRLSTDLQYIPPDPLNPANTRRVEVRKRN